MPIVNYYFDTSALFKRYIYEEGSDLVDRLMAEAKGIYTSNLTIIELVSNLKRLNEIDRRINAPTFTAIRNQLFNDIDVGMIKIEPLTSPIIINAVDLIQGKYITPIDSLQLATAVTLNEKKKVLVFVSADRKLSVLAQKNGLELIQLENSPCCSLSKGE